MPKLIGLAWVIGVPAIALLVIMIGLGVSKLCCTRREPDPLLIN